MQTIFYLVSVVLLSAGRLLAQDAGIVRADLCKVLEAPATYSGKVIQVSGFLEQDSRGLFLNTAAGFCGKTVDRKPHEQREIVAIFPSGDSLASTPRELRDLAGLFAGMRGHRNRKLSVLATVVGTFRFAPHPESPGSGSQSAWPMTLQIRKAYER